MLNRIPYTKPSITDLEIGYVEDAVTNGWGDHCYDYIDRFESLLAEHLGVRFAIATSSCTGALNLGLAALDIGIGDEVILADTNWVASVAPIVHLGAKPVFIDINPKTWCLDPQKVRSVINPRTKAILATHLYGNLCEMTELLAMGEEFGVPIIEDAAEAIGSIYQNKRAGSIGLFGVFSFHGTKTITTGEGGAFVTNDEDLYNKVLTLSNHGRARGQAKQFWPEKLGYKFKISNVQAAIGCGQLERVEELITRKQEILEKYQKSFVDLNGLSMNYQQDDCTLGAWMPTIVFDRELGITREMLLLEFAKENIDARVFFWPLSTLPFFEEVSDNKVSRDISNRSINLPSFHDMTSKEQSRVIEIVRKIYKVNSNT